MTKDQLTLANQLHNHLESCEVLVSNIDHAIRHIKEPAHINWNSILKQGIEDDIIGPDIAEKMLVNLREMVVAYSVVVDEELAAI